MTVRSVGKILVACVVAIAVQAGCDRGGGEAESSGEEKSEAVDVFTWRSALDASPGEASEVLGEYEDCEPEAGIPAPTPENRQYFLEGPKFCRFPGASEHAADGYFVERILYSEEEATAVSLKPVGELRMSDDVVEKLDLPELPVRRLRRVASGEEMRHVIGYRSRKRPRLAGVPFAIDIVSKAEDRELVDSIQVYAVSNWPYVIGYVQVHGPPVASDSLTLPGMRARLNVGDELYVEMGLDGGQISNYPRYPRSVMGSKLPSELDPVSLSAEQVSDIEALGEAFEGYLEPWQKVRKKVGRSESKKVALAVDEALPAGRVVEFMEAAGEHGIERFLVLARRIDTFGEERSRFAKSGASGVGYRTEGSGDLKLTVTVEKDGFRVEATGAMLPPIDGCPKQGPTICLKEEADVEEMAGEALELRRGGDYEAGLGKMDEVLAAYDWAALYEKLAKIAEQYPDERRIVVRTEPEIPFAVTARTVDVVGSKLALSDGEECVEELTGEEFEGAVPCRDEQQYEMLFPRAVVAGYGELERGGER